MQVAMVFHFSSMKAHQACADLAFASEILAIA
jgi:hypothetical protein